MKTRIIRPVPPKSIEAVPVGTMLTHGQLDYIDESEAAPPDDAKYVAVMDDAGAVAVVKDTFDPPRQVDSGRKDDKGKPIMEPAPNTGVHTFAGWPVPGVSGRKP